MDVEEDEWERADADCGCRGVKGERCFVGVVGDVGTKKFVIDSMSSDAATRDTKRVSGGKEREEEEKKGGQRLQYRWGERRQ